jgi:hypothetical protein
LRAFSAFFWLLPSSASMWMNSSFSKRCRNRRARAHHRIGRHQLRVREALVDVLVDDVRLVQHEIALDQHRHLVVRIHHCQVLGLVVEVDVDDLEVHALLVQHDAAALRERVGGTAVERHHVRVSPRRAIGLSRADIVGKRPVDIGLWPNLETRAFIWARLRSDRRVCNEPIEFATVCWSVADSIGCAAQRTGSRPCSSRSIDDAQCEPSAP